MLRVSFLVSEVAGRQRERATCAGANDAAQTEPGREVYLGDTLNRYIPSVMNTFVLNCISAKLLFQGDDSSSSGSAVPAASGWSGYMARWSGLT